MIARDILETGALYSVASEDIPGFERYLAQLKSYYLDYKIDLPESPYKYQLLGLNLLSLLSQNRYVGIDYKIYISALICRSVSLSVSP